MRRLLSFLLAVGAVASARAQAPSALAFEHLRMQEGLPENSAFALLQDRRGFVWFGTQNGLVRYDGHTMHAFRHDPKKPGSLCDWGAYSLQQDRQGRLWAGSQGVLMRFDPATEQTTCFRSNPADAAAPSAPDLSTLVQDRNDGLWITYTSDAYWATILVAPWRRLLDRVDTRTGRLTRFRHDARNPHSLASDTLSGRGAAVRATSDGAVWIALHGGGLDRYDARTGRFLHVRPDPGNPTALSAGTAGFLYEPPRQPGVLWMSMEAPRGGVGAINRFDLRTGRTTRYRHDPSDPSSLGLTRPASVFEDRSGRLWVLGNGLDRLDERTGRFARVLPAPPPYATAAADYVQAHEDRSGRLWLIDAEARLSVFDPARGVLLPHPIARADGAIQAWMEDRAGTVWVGTWGNGVFRLDAAATRFQSFTRRPGAPDRSIAGAVRGMERASEGRIWLGLADTLARFDPASGRVQHLTRDAYALHRDRAGRLWMATMTTLDELDEQGTVRRSIRYDPAFSEIAGLSSRPTAVVEGLPGVLWIGTYGRGLYEVNTGTGRVRHFQNAPNDPASLSDNFPMDLAWDARDGTLWVGTNNLGFNHLDPRTGRFTRYADTPSASLASVQAVHVDRAGRLWLGSYHDGLHLFDRATGRTRRFSVAEGLPDTNAGTIGEDAQGAIWVGTNTGIARLDLARGAFQAFGRADGITGDDFRKGPLFTPDGQAYVGSFDGLTMFTPAALAPARDEPPVVLTGLRIGDRLVTPGPGSALPTSITTARRLALPHADNDLTFEFAALAFDRNPAVRYSYQLEGYDDDWSAPTADRAARYTNLSPGRYTFRVRAANADRVWSKSQARLVVVIRPPWWRTWWAHALYGLLVLAALLGLVRAVRHRARLRERERVREERERARERELAQAKEIEAAYTQLKGTQQQLVQQEKLASLGALTAGIAHEIKNPLNFVNNFAALSRDLVNDLRADLVADPARPVADAVADNADLFDDLAANVTRIEEHGRRADSIVKNMLAHSRGSAGAKERVDMNALVDEYTSLTFHGVRAQRPDFTCTIERDLSASPAVVEAVPQDVSRVLLNVVGNAFYAVGKRREAEGAAYEPTVRVSTRREGGSVTVEVWDNGGGIPDAVRAKIFEPFFTTKPTGEGTGLGLSLSNDIVAAHGGTLAVESSGGATTFTITLPSTSSHAAPSHPVAP